MSYLTIKERQQYMKELGFYEGKVDGLEGIKTLKAYANLQVRYFARPDDVDGKYGKNTDNLLRSAYVCKDLKYFELPEFKCKCGGKYCTGYPAALNKDLLTNLDKLRKILGSSLTITSGLRCEQWNKQQKGATGSRHKLGKAADVSGTETNTKSKRKHVKKIWMSQKNARYTYCQEDSTKYKMGNSVHVDVK